MSTQQSVQTVSPGRRMMTTCLMVCSAINPLAHTPPPFYGHSTTLLHIRLDCTFYLAPCTLYTAANRFIEHNVLCANAHTERYIFVPCTRPSPD